MEAHWKLLVLKAKSSKKKKKICSRWVSPFCFLVILKKMLKERTLLGFSLSPSLHSSLSLFCRTYNDFPSFPLLEAPKRFYSSLIGCLKNNKETRLPLKSRMLLARVVVAFKPFAQQGCSTNKVRPQRCCCCCCRCCCCCCWWWRSADRSVVKYNR